MRKRGRQRRLAFNYQEHEESPASREVKQRAPLRDFQESIEPRGALRGESIRMLQDEDRSPFLHIEFKAISQVFEASLRYPVVSSYQTQATTPTAPVDSRLTRSPMTNGDLITTE
jgi:hypothetical protein